MEEQDISIDAARHGYLDSDNYNDIACVAAKHGYLHIVESIPHIDIEDVAICAAMRGHDRIIMKMIERGAKDRTSILSALTYGGYIDLIPKYMDGSVDLDQVAYTASRRGRLDILDILINMGASDYDYMALAAAESGRRDILIYLIEKGVKDLAVISEVAVDNGHIDLAYDLDLDQL